MPSGSHVPFSQTLLEGPRSSNPLSHEYVATAPGPKSSSENITDECAGDPGNLQPICSSPLTSKIKISFENIGVNIINSENDYAYLFLAIAISPIF